MYIDVLDGVKNMVSNDGSRALWRGLPPTLWRDVPFSAIYWMGYEQCKNAIELHNRHYVALTDLQVTFAAGALSGMVRVDVNYDPKYNLTLNLFFFFLS